MASLATPDIQYTVFVRLPFPRGDFIDPPPPDWNPVKDRALWEILSRPAKGDDIDWKAIADEFNVTLSFLLQQAAWLYDRQLSQVRAQMRKVGNTQAASPSPALGSVSGSGALGGQAMKRVGSGGSRVPSRLSALQRENQPLRTDSAASTAKPKASSIRTSSSNTVMQTQTALEQPAEDTPAIKTLEPSARRPSTRRERPTLSVLQKVTKTEEKSPPASSDESESESESDEDVSTRRMPGTRRFGKFSMHKPGLRDDDEDDEDESPAFLPLSHGTQQMNSTLGQETRAAEAQRRPPGGHVPPHRRELISLDSSASSGGVAGGSPRSGPQRPSGPLSPRRVANLSRQDSARTGSANQSSEETPSMGSSFSDLDDASVTQSALEEALASNMQHGGMTSRMSTISQALRIAKYVSVTGNYSAEQSFRLIDCPANFGIARVYV
ncbi:Autophagy-related protein 29 [Talaromyces islandicus]|uniref:Autophagy-related protein 29 n=1 Tax=Talaromyces islandicus TaxID=28573 RepID=A0A0U1LIH2_TALIS|nr:Autophagy-related protein 29 [Talaromyces islandicus]